jgi:hypothetical protein
MLFIVALFALIAYAAYLGSGPGAAPESQPSSPSSGGLCTEGQTQACSIGSCSGVSRCINGVWSGCRWDTVCTPGTKVPCLSNGCVYAVKECNQCGTGYTDCFLPNSTSSAPPDPQ